MTKTLAHKVARILRTRGYGAIVVGTIVVTDAIDSVLADVVVESRLGGR